MGRPKGSKNGATPVITFDEAPCPVEGLVGPCHVFRGDVHKNGYGRVWHERRYVGAHRYVWERDVGPISAGTVLDHQCRNRACVNVAHLRVVTHRINSIENSTSVAAVNAVKTACPRGHEYDERNTYRLNGARFCRACNRQSHVRRARA
jgi:hypothetical protein